MLSTKGTPVVLLFLFTACVEPLSLRPAAQSSLPSSFHRGGSQGTDQPELLSSFARVSYTTIADILRRPILFEGRWIRVRGNVGKTHSIFQPEESSKTIFHLVDPAGNAVTIETADRTVVRERQELTVEGKVFLSDTTTSSSVAVVVTDARIVSASSRREKKRTPAATTNPARRSPSQQRPPADSSGEGRIF